MKILMLLDHVFPPDVRVENEIESLAAAGFDVHIACFRRDGEKEFEKTKICTIHRRHISEFLKKSSVGALKFPFYFNFWIKFASELCEKEKFDVVHVHDLPLAKVGCKMRKSFGMRFVLDLHENWPVLLQLSQHTKSPLGKLLSSNKQWVRYEKKMCMEADRVVVVVEEAKRRITPFVSSPDKITVVSNTLNISQFDVVERKTVNSGPLKMLYVGGINYHRGIQYVIEAISILKKENIDVYFDLVGFGRYLPEIEKLIKERGVSDNVTVHGYKKYTDIADIYEAADVAVIPHIKSGHSDNTIPHKIFQYMYAGIPMLVSDCDPLVRIVNETHSGVEYSYDNPAELASLIKDFYADRNLLTQYIKQGRKAVEDKYNWTVDGRKLVNMYQKLETE